MLGRLIRWRIPGTHREESFSELFRCYPFTVLEEDEGVLISGLCGRIWTLARDYPRLDGPESFEAWNEPGTVRVLFAHWVEPAGADAWKLVSEARVQPVDDTARRRVRALWRIIGPFERLVGSEALTATLTRAEELREPHSDGRPRERRTARRTR